MNLRDDFILSKIHDGYLVGGCVRDFLLNGEFSEDRDISIKGAENFAKKLAEEFDATFIILDEENKIYRVVLKDKENYLDISELQGNSIEDDLSRRDFTINAIAYDLKTDTIIDITGGQGDLEQRILRHIKEENFIDDPLRILRAYRFLAVTGFEPKIELTNILRKHVKMIAKPAKERISYELMKLFGGEFCSQTLLKMDEDGILETLFPNINEMKKVPPNTHHHLDLFHHSVETVKQIEILYKNSSSEVTEHLLQTDFGGYPRINHLKLAGFLHDIGKFSTWTIEESGRHRFIKHDDVGSKMIIPILQKMKFSKKQINYISCMVKNHIYPSNVLAAPELSEKVMMRYIRKMENDVIDNIMLAKADRLSARGVDITEEIINSNLQGLDTLLNFYLEKRETLKPLPKLLDGLEIMKLKGIKQSPELGEIINALYEAQLNGDVVTKDDAINFVLKIN